MRRDPARCRGSGRDVDAAAAVARRCGASKTIAATVHPRPMAAAGTAIKSLI
jgi:hypothetical protein